MLSFSVIFTYPLLVRICEYIPYGVRNFIHPAPYTACFAYVQFHLFYVSAYKFQPAHPALSTNAAGCLRPCFTPRCFYSYSYSQMDSAQIPSDWLSPAGAAHVSASDCSGILSVTVYIGIGWVIALNLGNRGFRPAQGIEPAF